METTTPVGVTKARATSGPVGGGSVVVVLGIVVVLVAVVDVVVVELVVTSAPAFPEQAPMRTTRTRSRGRIPGQVKPEDRSNR
jgi:hypothetical protein